MIRVEGLTKRYGRTQALRGISFRVEAGSIFGFVGPNGAGKTTTMRILAALERADGGRAEVAGFDVASAPGAVRRSVGYMPDFFGVYDHLKVTEYLEFYASAYDIPPARRRAIAADLLELVDLSHKADAYVDTLSRGMKQRLCLARCLVHDPPVLILDEPASGLDPRARVEMRELLKELQRMGKTILVSSHILAELAEMCTHIGIIEAGRIVAAGSVDEILRRVRLGAVLSIRLLGRWEEAAALLREYPGVEYVSGEGDVLEVGFAGGPADQSRLLAHMVGAGFPVVSFAESRGTLEELFLQITEGAVG